MGRERRDESTPESENGSLDEVLTKEGQKWLRMMAAMHKPWLTQDEAAFYCGVSSSQFRKYRREFEFPVYEGMGKLLFSRQHLDALIEATQSVPTTGADGRGISPYLRAGARIDLPARKQRKPRLRDQLKTRT